MSFRTFSSIGFVWLALFLPASCSRNPQPTAPAQLAIGPFENLTPDRSLDWLSSAIPEVIAHQLSGAPDIRAFPTGDTTSADTLSATRYLHGYFTSGNGRLVVHAAVEDLTARQILYTVEAEGGGAQDIVKLADEVARKVYPEAKAYPSISAEAVRRLALARMAKTPEEAEEQYRRAISSAPYFGAAYLGLIQLHLNRNDPQGAKQAVTKALENESKLDPLDRARLQLYLAVLEEDREKQKAALEQLARLSPADPTPAIRLAALESSRQNYKASLIWYERAIASAPQDSGLLNQAGYTYAMAGDLEKARKALEQYQELAPESLNPLDSLGDIHFYLGKFEEAERYYLEAFRKNQRFLAGRTAAKAAYSRLLRGDETGANELFAQYRKALESWQDPLVPLRVAQWRWATGDRREARAMLRGSRSENPSVRALEAAQLSVWLLEQGDRQQASQAAAEAAAVAKDMASQRLAMLARFLSLDSGPPNVWRERAEAGFPGDAQKVVRNLALSYALMMNRHFAEAEQVLRDLLPEIGVTASEPVTLLLGQALLERGDFDAAGQYLKPSPAQQLSGEQIFSYLVFPRIFELRARYYEGVGDTQAAEAARRLYQLYTPEERGKESAPSTGR